MGHPATDGRPVDEAEQPRARLVEGVDEEPAAARAGRRAENPLRLRRPAPLPIGIGDRDQTDPAGQRRRHPPQRLAPRGIDARREPDFDRRRRGERIERREDVVDEAEEPSASRPGIGATIEELAAGEGPGHGAADAPGDRGDRRGRRGAERTGERFLDVDDRAAAGQRLRGFVGIADAHEQPRPTHVAPLAGAARLAVVRSRFSRRTRSTESGSHHRPSKVTEPSCHAPHSGNVGRSA